MKHKHAELIHAWADGAEIELFYKGVWRSVTPYWDSDDEFRIKPPEPSKPEMLKKAWTDAYDAYYAELNKEEK